VKKGTSFGSVATKWGDTSEIVASRSVSTFILKGASVSDTFSLKRVGLAKAGTTVGTAVFVVGTQTYSVPLVLAKSIRDPGVGWRLAHPGALS
jgi:D-alanyl-D-alanine carboxypeptidase (penicillin-binding protein 5/6)